MAGRRLRDHGAAGHARCARPAESPACTFRTTAGKVFASGKIKQIADPVSYEAANNPDGGSADSNLYGVLALPGRQIVADAGGNTRARGRCERGNVDPGGVHVASEPDSDRSALRRIGRDGHRAGPRRRAVRLGADRGTVPDWIRPHPPNCSRGATSVRDRPHRSRRSRLRGRRLALCTPARLLRAVLRLSWEHRSRRRGAATHGGVRRAQPSVGFYDRPRRRLLCLKQRC